MHTVFRINRFYKFRICCFLLFLYVNTYAQTHTDSIKQRIQQLQSGKNIIAANRILNQNTSLDANYTFEILQENLKLAEEIKDFEAIAYTYLSIGNFWFIRGNKIKAYENYRSSETMSRKYGYEKITGLALMNASNVSNHMENRISQLKMAIPFFTSTDDRLNLAKAYLNIGNCYSTYILGSEVIGVDNINDSILSRNDDKENNRHFRDSAFYYYKLAKVLNDTLQHHELSGSYHLRIAQWLSYDNQLDEAEKYFQISSYHFNQARLFKGTVYCLIELIKCKIKQNNLIQAHILADSVIALSLQHRYTDYYSEACLVKSGLYEKTNNFAKALHFFKLYYTTAEKNNASLIEEKINALNLELTIKDNENTINSLTQQSKIKELIVILVIGFAAFIIVAAFLFMQNRRRKIKYMQESIKKAEELNEMQISLLNTQLENNTLQARLLEEKINARSETLIMVANKMQKLKNYYDLLNENINKLVHKLSPERNHDEIKSVKLSLIQIAQEQNNLLELNSFSKYNNQEFFFMIEKKFPTLTNEDKNLLSMLIADLNTKQIAELLNINSESVFKKRYRLRKKLNIPNKISFADFYKDIVKSGSATS